MDEKLKIKKKELNIILFHIPAPLYRAFIPLTLAFVMDSDILFSPPMYMQL
jgi:hypothetical protein